MQSTCEHLESHEWRCCLTTSELAFGPCDASSDLGHTTDPVRHTEITLQDGTNSTYHLELFVGYQEIELQKNDNRNWTPVQRSYVPCFLIIYPH